MGFYIRKSLQAGPFRLNLSKSGLGVSVGIKGLRVGTGPRGNYIHMGRKGIYYRASLGGPPGGRPAAGTFDQPVFQPDDSLIEELSGTIPVSLDPTDPDDVVNQLNHASKKLFFRSSHKVVLFYDVNDEHAQWFDSLVQSWSWMLNCQRLWRILRSQALESPYEQKMNAGSTSLVSRAEARATLDGPRHLSTNIHVPSIETGDSGLYFLPDRLLVREEWRYSAVHYNELVINCSTIDFNEDAPPPADAEIIGSTWQAVNKDGSPDRRVAANRQIPVLRYGQVDISTATGLRWVLQTSNANAAAALARMFTSQSGSPPQPAYNGQNESADLGPSHADKSLAEMVAEELSAWSPGIPVNTAFNVGERVECRTAGQIFDGMGIVRKISMLLWLGGGTPVYPAYQVSIDSPAHPGVPAEQWYMENGLKRLTPASPSSTFSLGERVHCLSGGDVACQSGTVALITAPEEGGAPSDLRYHVMLDPIVTSGNSGRPSWTDWPIRLIPTAELRALGGPRNADIPIRIDSWRSQTSVRQRFQLGDTVLCDPDGVGVVQSAGIHWEFNGTPNRPTYRVLLSQPTTQRSPLALWYSESALSKTAGSPNSVALQLGDKVECRSDSDTYEGLGIVVCAALVQDYGSGPTYEVFHVLIDPKTTNPDHPSADWRAWPGKSYRKDKILKIG